ncbi:hypothetical protein BH11MYX1_BH11MYX1_53910 [soil metagenome]
MQAVRRAVVLRYAAFQFVVLVATAMVLYPGGNYADGFAPHYRLTLNFLSDLGATRAWSGSMNYASCALFFTALTTIGAALIAFAWSWRRFAFGRGRAAWAGYASAVFGTASGAAFLGIAVTPVNLALTAHNSFVLAAFGSLLGYVACITIVMAANGAKRLLNAINAAYLLVVLGYVALVLFGPRLNTEGGFRTQVIGQKLVALASMIHITFLTTQVARAAAKSLPSTAHA